MKFLWLLYIVIPVTAMPGCQKPGQRMDTKPVLFWKPDQLIQKKPPHLLSCINPGKGRHDETRLNYFTDRGDYYLLEFSQSGSSVFRLGAVSEIDSMVLQYRQSILNKKADRLGGFLLLRKLLPSGYPPNNQELYVTTAGSLHGFPFETLVVDTSGCRPAYLLEYCPVLYALPGDGVSDITTTYYQAGLGLLCLAPDYTGSSLPVLPYARQEAQAVAAFSKHAKILAGQQASKNNFIREAGRYNILHIAAHSAVSHHPPQHAYIYFHSGNRPDSISAQEISQLRLQSQLVILSSCHSLCDPTRPGEDILNLGRAFQKAGASNLAATTWNAPDKTTSAIVIDFYKMLKAGQSKAVALRTAKLQYLENADAMGAQPYFWAGLVLYGDRSPLIFHDMSPAVYYYSALFTLLALLFIYFLRKKIVKTGS
jgi:hypothetical protein